MVFDCVSRSCHYVKQSVPGPINIYDNSCLEVSTFKYTVNFFLRVGPPSVHHPTGLEGRCAEIGPTKAVCGVPLCASEGRDSGPAIINTTRACPH